jgi:transaldolase
MWADGRGLRIVNKLKKKHIKTNMTCMVNTNQILLAVQAEATYASLFFNRARDTGIDPVKVIEESMRIIRQCKSETQLIVGSIRKPEDVHEIAVASPHIITVPYKILVQLPMHPMTEKTISEFDAAWKEFKKYEAQT